MTLSTSFLSMLAAAAPATTVQPVRVERVNHRVSPEQVAMRRCAAYCRSLGEVELAVPAQELGDHAVAKWVRDHGVSVDVRSGSDLTAAIAAGIHPIRMTVHADGLIPNELLFCTANLGVGRVVATETEHVELLAAAAVPHRRQRVLVGFGFESYGADDAIAAVLAGPRLDLVGLHCEISSGENYFAGYPAAVGDMLIEMAQIHREHGIVLTRAAVGGGGLVFGHCPCDLSELAEAIDETLDDACATLRFPRPVVMAMASPARVA